MRPFHLLAAAFAPAFLLTACASIVGLGDSRSLDDSPDAAATASDGGDSGADVTSADGGPRDASHDSSPGAQDGDADVAPDAAPDAPQPPTGPDTAYPAIVALRRKNGAFFCSGTLISSQVVLTSARCFPAFANGCSGLHGTGTEADSSEVVFSWSGVLGAGDNVALEIDDIEAAPSAYPIRRNDCPAGSRLSCDDEAGGDAGAPDAADGGASDARPADAGDPDASDASALDGGPSTFLDASPPDAGDPGLGDAGSTGDGGSVGDAGDFDGGLIGLRGDAGLGLRVGSDLVLLHLQSPAPSSIRPIPVLTSLANESFDGGSTVHAALDSNPAFSDRASAPLPRMVGWGSSDCAHVERRVGLAQFETIGPHAGDWHQGCAEWFACDLSRRADLGCTVTDRAGGKTGSPNWYSTNEVRIANTSSDAGVFDGPLPPSGDLGSPLLLDAVDLAGVPVSYVVGTLSVSPASNDCTATPRGHASSRYSASFSPENGDWIEKTLAYFSGSFYPWDGSWSKWEQIETGTGPIAMGPAAESQGLGRVDSFVVGADSSIYGEVWNDVYWYTGNGPINWDSSQGTLDQVTSAPSACSWGPDRMDVVARAADGSVMHWWYVDGWLNERLGGFVFPGTGPTIATWGPNSSLFVFVIGGDRHLYSKSKIAVPGENRAGQGWPIDWQDLGTYVPAAAASPAAVAWTPGRIDVFTEQADGSLVHLFQDADAAQLAWQVETVPSPPIARGLGVGVTSWMPGRLDFAARGGNDPSSIVWFGRTSQGWRANAPRAILSGADPGSTPALASMAPGRLDLFARGAVGGSALYHAWFGSK